MTTTPRRSLQYLLSVDRGLRKISLRRLRTATTARTRRQRIRRTSKRRRAAPDHSFTGRALTVAGIALIAIAAFAASRGAQQLSSAEALVAATSTLESPQTISIAGAGGATPAPPPAVDDRHRPEVATAGHIARPAAVSATTASPRPSAARPTDAPAPAIARKTSGAARTEPAAATLEHSADDASPSVTIAGCVERDRKSFWLKSVSGDDVPRTRSWKSGFFRKRASSLALTDATDGVGLEGYVGQRVAATGRLANGELRANSLQQLAGSCSGS